MVYRFSHDEIDASDPCVALTINQHNMDGLSAAATVLGMIQTSRLIT